MDEIIAKILFAWDEEGFYRRQGKGLREINDGVEITTPSFL